MGRLAELGSDTCTITPEDQKPYVIGALEEINIRKVDEFAFVGLLTDPPAKSRGREVTTLDIAIPFQWSEANIAGLRERSAAGVSAGRMADELGHGVTRNMVVGKVRDVTNFAGRPRDGGAVTWNKAKRTKRPGERLGAVA